MSNDEAKPKRRGRVSARQFLRQLEADPEKGTRFTVIYRSRPAFQILPVDDAGSASSSLADDPLYRAPPVGSSDDGRTAIDHDAVLYPR
jgi:hypothetical protein